MVPSLQSLRRRKRATVATMLLTVHEQGELVEPESWSWSMLDALPHWCLMEAPARRRLQAIAGAVLLAPIIRRWIDPRYLERVRDCVGDAVLESLLDETPTIEGVDFISASATPEFASGVDALLLDAGATVLLGSLHERFQVSSLAVDIGQSLGPLPIEVAEKLLLEAGRLMTLGNTLAPVDASALTPAPSVDASLESATS